MVHDRIFCHALNYSPFLGRYMEKIEYFCPIKDTLKP